MKKFFSTLIIAAVLVLSCTACGSSNNTEATKSTAHSHSHTNSSETTQAETQSASQTESADTKAPSVIETSPQHKPSALSRGSFSGDTYTNNLLGLSFTLPAGWTYYSDNELCSLSGLSPDTYSDFTNAAKNNPAVYDMYAIHKESGASVSLCYENLLMTTGSVFTEREYLEFIKAAVAGAGVSEINDYGTVSFCSNIYENATILSGDGEVKTRQTYYLKAYDNYMVTIIVTSKLDATESDIISMFS